MGPEADPTLRTSPEDLSWNEIHGVRGGSPKHVCVQTQETDRALALGGMEWGKEPYRQGPYLGGGQSCWRLLTVLTV